MEKEPALVTDVWAQLMRRFQYYLDKTVIYPIERWVGLATLIALYCWRAWYLRGWYIVNYGLGIFFLNLFIGFLTPQIDPETDGPLLPTTNAEEFRPFSRKVPEFQFWYGTIKAVFIATFMTMLPFFNIPVFWPVLVLYFFALLGVTLKDRVAHMLKHRYVPWNWVGKRRPQRGVAA